MAEVRTKQEMEALEIWIDDVEKQLYDNASKEGRRRSSVILSDEFIELVQNVKDDYEAKGFMKRRVQEAMETVMAVKPFTSAKFGTLREKNNTLMNFLLTLEAKQKEKKEAVRREAEMIERERIDREKERMEAELREAELKERERLEAEKREIERKEAERLHEEWKKAEALKDQELDLLSIPDLNPLFPSQLLDIHGNPLKLSGSRRNTLAECLGWLTSWDTDSDGESQDTKTKSWRVRL